MTPSSETSVDSITLRMTDSFLVLAGWRPYEHRFGPVCRAFGWRAMDSPTGEPFSLSREVELLRVGDPLRRHRWVEERVGHRLGERIGRLAVAADRQPEVVLRSPQADIRTEDRPEGTRLSLVGHSDAAGVDRAHDPG